MPARLGRRGALLALLVATAAFRMTQNMALTTLSLLAREAVHLGAGAIGALGAISGIAVAVVTLVLSRRVPHHWAAVSAAAGMGGLALALLVLATAPSFAVLAAGAVLLGVAGGFAMPGLLNAIVAESGRQRERVIAVYTVTLSVSLAAGPLAETVVLALAHQAVRVPYVVFAALPCVGVPLALLASRHRAGSVATSPPELSETGGGDLVVDPSTDEVVAVTAEPVLGFGGPSHRSRPGRWRTGLLSTSAGRMAIVSELLYGIPFAGITVFGALVARVGYGFTPARAQLGFTVFFVLSFAARAAVAWRAPIVRKRALLMVSAGLTLAGLALLGLGHGAAVLFVAMGLLGIPHGLTFPLALALVAEATPVARLPRANATLLGSANVTGVVVPLVLGGIIPAVGYRGMTLVLLAPVAVFSAMLAGLRHRPASGRVGDLGKTP
jgi:DHA1 family multidrug resistance protein-like MFS transporter